MLGLQREQLEHDELFHTDILRLNLHARLNHMALHFCKYTGQFAKVYASGDANLRLKTITDSFIISLCCANSLNINLSEYIAPKLTEATLCDIGFYLARELYPETKLDDGWLLMTHAVHAGQMARACEKIDHLEMFPFRVELQEAVLRLCQVAIIGANANSMNLLSAVRERHREIRNRTRLLSALKNSTR